MSNTKKRKENNRTQRVIDFAENASLEDLEKQINKISSEILALEKSGNQKKQLRFLAWQKKYLEEEYLKRAIEQEENKRAILDEQATNDQNSKETGSAPSQKEQNSIANNDLTINGLEQLIAIVPNFELKRREESDKEFAKKQRAFSEDKKHLEEFLKREIERINLFTENPDEFAKLQEEEKKDPELLKARLSWLHFALQVFEKAPEEDSTKAALEYLRKEYKGVNDQVLSLDQKTEEQSQTEGNEEPSYNENEEASDRGRKPLLANIGSILPTIAVGSLTGAVSKVGIQFALAKVVATVPGLAALGAAVPFATPLVISTAAIALAGGITSLVVTSLFGNKENREENWKKKAFGKGFVVGALAGGGIAFTSLFAPAAFGLAGIAAAGSFTGALTRIASTVMDNKRTLKDITKALLVGVVVGGISAGLSSLAFASPHQEVKSGLESTSADTSGADPDPIGKTPQQPEQGQQPQQPQPEQPQEKAPQQAPESQQKTPPAEQSKAPQQPEQLQQEQKAVRRSSRVRTTARYDEIRSGSPCITNIEDTCKEIDNLLQKKLQGKISLEQYQRELEEIVRKNGPRPRSLESTYKQIEEALRDKTTDNKINSALEDHGFDRTQQRAQSVANWHNRLNRILGVQMFKNGICQPRPK